MNNIKTKGSTMSRGSDWFKAYKKGKKGGKK